VQLVGTAGGVQAENQLVAGQAQAVVGFFDHLLDLQSKGDIDLDIPTIFGRKTIF
jgi:NitT/TauT family transport system substrate-binding protein